MKSARPAKTRSPGSPYALLVFLVLAAVAAPLSSNKASPISATLTSAFGINRTQFGLLLSVFSVAGIFLALPGGWLVRRFGPWKCVLASLCALLLGSLLGTYSPSFALLLASRAVEGIGLALVCVAGPAIVGQTMPKKKLGMAMAIFAGYCGIGQVAAFNLAPLIAARASWRGVWWFSTAYTFAALVMWVAVMLRRGAFGPAPAEAAGRTEASGAPAVPPLQNRSLLLLAFSMCAYALSYVTIQSFLPTYLSAARGLPVNVASSLSSICCVVGIPASIAAGTISDRFRSRRLFGAVCGVLAAALFALLPFVPVSFFAAYSIILGSIPPILCVVVLADAPGVLTDPGQLGFAMGLLMLGQNVGYVAGPVLFAAISQAAGWPAAFFTMAPFVLLSGTVLLFTRPAERTPPVPAARG